MPVYLIVRTIIKVASMMLPDRSDWWAEAVWWLVVVGVCVWLIW
jgi:hypothetical protein